MYMRIIVGLFIVSSWYIKAMDVQEPCPPVSTEKLIHVCIENKLNNLENVYVSTSEAPNEQAFECSCIITPSVSSEHYNVQVQGASEILDNNTSFTFSFNDVVIKETANFGDLTQVKLKGETILKYSSPYDDTVLVCVNIGALKYEDMFNIQCMKSQINDTTSTTFISSTTTSTTTSPILPSTTDSKSSSSTESIVTSAESTQEERTKTKDNSVASQPTESTDMSTMSQPNNNTYEDNTILIAAAAGGGVALIIIVVIVIVCCRRKRKSPPKEATSNEATSRADARPASFCDGSDDDDYGMVLNPSYQPFHEVLPNQPPPNSEKVETALTGETSASPPVYATPLKRKVSQDTANGITTTAPNTDNTKKGATRQSGDVDNPASHYDYPRHHTAQVVTSDIDDTYDNTFTSASGKWTGNEYNRVPMRRNEESNFLDHDTYNVLKL